MLEITLTNRKSIVEISVLTLAFINILIKISETVIWASDAGSACCMAGFAAYVTNITQKISIRVISHFART